MVSANAGRLCHCRRWDWRRHDADLHAAPAPGRAARGGHRLRADPALAAGLSIWTAYPILISLYYSLTDYNVFQPPKWVGLDNYIRIFTRDPNFWPSLRL